MAENLCYTAMKAFKEKYGSVGEASRELNVTKTTILNQCKHKVKTKPRCGY